MMTGSSRTKLKLGLLVLAVATGVCVPFFVWGESAFTAFLSPDASSAILVAVAILLLAADAVAPVPATLVIMILAAKAGPIAGIIGGTVGLSMGVLAAGVVGRSAVGRLAPRFLSTRELARLRVDVQHRLAITLGCLRSLPVLAETSVMIAAAAGVPIRRLFVATLLPNAVIATIYSVAADDSLEMAAEAFTVTAVFSYGWWRAQKWCGRRRERPR